MGDQFNKDLCEERHKMIQDNIKTLFNRLNWFYIIAIATLVSSLANLILK
jgi:hypothetical protein